MNEEQERIAAEARQNEQIASVEIHRKAMGFRVETNPPIAGLRYTAIGHSNAKFSRAAGYGAKLAAELGVRLIDRTERLSEKDCTDLVDAMN